MRLTYLQPCCVVSEQRWSVLVLVVLLALDLDLVLPPHHEVVLLAY
jgi:hypothetical protein